MTIKTCDKCGANIIKNPAANLKLPTFTIFGLHVAYRLMQVIPETIGQYTGLTDKNGKKIFEGDILKIIHKYQSPFDDDTNEYTDITTDVVHFDDEGLCFSYGKSPFLCVVDNVTAEYEVIGNIHDNPELLGGEDK